MNANAKTVSSPAVPAVKFGRGKQEKVGRVTGTPYGNTLYRSKCGRFSIERMEFNMPVRCTEYRLTDSKTGKVYKDWAEKLADAKTLAQNIVNEEHGIEVS
jgi:hypothetical protein